MLTDIGAYLGLFIAALMAATILPMQSEAVLAGLLIHGAQSAWALIIVASLGNVAGSVINWGLGRGILHYQDRRWFPASPAALARAQHWYKRHGRLSLLLSWVPIIGDPITVAAGVMGERLLPFVLLVTIAKIGRYLVVAMAALHWA